MMSFINQISPYAWLLLVPVIIFSATPRMPRWYKSGRIVFMWMAALAGISFTYGILPDYDPDWHGSPYKHYFLKHNFMNVSLFALFNMYMGWWEFLWRSIYRQWAWPPLKIFQYGIVSNLCILGAISVGLFSIIMLIFIFARIF